MENALVLKNDKGEISVVAEVLSKYQSLKEQAKELDKQISEIENQLKSELKEMCFETTKIGDLSFIVSGGFFTTDFDMETFKKENPLIYLKYIKPKQSKETYKLTYGKAKKNV